MAIASEQAASPRVEAGEANVARSGNRTPSVDAYVGELLSRIQPARASEERRRSVAQYVQDLIGRAFQPAFEVKAFTYGSVPLKTYLPDGDIDLAIFQSGRGTSAQLRDTWFHQLSAYLQSEERNPAAQFRIRDVHVIHAEVKLVKCLVDNIVVDISFQSLGGLCTVNFLESIDRRIDDHHLFKRSIILVKAWCYYESRLLGAHHGLISTYALETMVLYIFMVYHQSVTTPLKVLHKFLTVFSCFDWDKQCVSLQGPIPLATFPDPKPLPYPDSEGAPLLKDDFMADMRHMYSPPGLHPDGGAPSTTPRSFQLKFLNIMDPLLPTNNLGRSVNRSSFARVRRALEYGAKRLTTILEMDPPEALDAARAFFRNTWNAQRSQPADGKPRTPVRPSPPTLKPTQPAEAQQRLLAGPQNPHVAAPGSAKAQQAVHPGVAGGWQAFQVLGATAPLFVQQQQHRQQQLQQHLQHQQLQQLVYQIGQHHMQHGTVFRPLQARPPAAEADRHRGFARANSLPLEQAAAEARDAKADALRQMHSQPNGWATGKAGDGGPPSAAPNGHRNGLQPRAAQKDSQAKPSRSAPVTACNSGPASPVEEAVSTATWRDSASNGMLPQHIGFLPVTQPGGQRMVPFVTMHPAAGRLPDFYQQPYPLLLPGGVVPGYRGMHPGYVAARPHPGAPGPQRHSDPGTAGSADFGGDSADATLSGDLERLSQHLQSARAMYDSNDDQPGRPGSDAPPAYRQLGSHSQGAMLRGPTRSSSAGNLNHLRATAFPAAVTRRPVRPDANGSAFEPHYQHVGTYFPANGLAARPRFAVRPPHAEQPPMQRMAQPDSQGHESRPNGTHSEKAPSQPQSPAAGKANGHNAMLLGPTPVVPGPLPEWPLHALKQRPQTGEWAGEAGPGRPGWSTASEGRPGWDSPGGSTYSEQSLASLRGLRLGGASPAPPSPPLRGSSLRSVGSYEGQPLPPDAVQQGGVLGPRDALKQWHGDFVLSEEDFPVLPSAAQPQPPAGTPSQPAARAPAWLGEARKAAA